MSVPPNDPTAPVHAGVGTEPERDVLGARLCDAGCRFGLWAPHAQHCSVCVVDSFGLTLLEVPMQRTGGHWTVQLPAVRAGALYRFVVDGRSLPDPRARYLPHGVHGPAEVVAEIEHAEPRPPPRSLDGQVLYELHVGTFTEQGTFLAAIDKLPHLVSLGVTALELMPIAAFAGGRNWGYDGVAMFATAACYGRPEHLASFVDAAHAHGLRVLLDVVYNHFGPSGNYLEAFDAAYFSESGSTAWGKPPDFEHPAMRAYFLDNVRYWLLEHRLDGLRLDATHAIADPSLLAEIAAFAKAHGCVVIAEDERNQPRLVRETGLSAIWADDFHHCVHTTLTREREGYYAGYSMAQDLARTVECGWLYEGQTFPGGGPRGAPADGVPNSALVYCLQNHDQIGNRAFGERLHELVGEDAFAAATMLLLFLPATPLLFMGQEWGATAPFLYFTDHDAELGARVCAGRQQEFAAFAAFAQGACSVPDPQAEETFMRSKLRWEEALAPRGQALLELHRRAIALRHSDPVLAQTLERPRARALSDEVLVVERSAAGAARTLLVNFGAEPVTFAALPGAELLLQSRPQAWADGALAPRAAVLFAHPRGS